MAAVTEKNVPYFCAIVGNDPFYHAMLCYCGISCHRVSVCPSVTCHIVSKWLNAESRKQHHTITQGLQFSDAKGVSEIRIG